ncbi:MAG: penicillin acylase family protein [Acidobacteriota bacterium]
MKRWLKLLAGGLLTVMIIAALVAFWWLRRPWPQVSGELTLAGLEAPVEVLRDELGVPQIYANSAADLFFAQGFVHAQDRMWQMEFNRRGGHGTLSAVLGPGTLRYDRASITLGLGAAAQREVDAMPAEARSLLEAYAAGVNAYLDSHRGRLALEFQLVGVDPEPWTAVDSVVLVKLMYWILAENASFEVSRARFLARVDEAAVAALLPPYSDGAPVIVPSEADGYSWLKDAELEGFKELAPVFGNPGPHQGSNSWAVTGERTTTGRPMLANDTHLDLFMPSAWYANGLHGDGFEVVGFSLIGAPGVVLGHNGTIAWGIADLVPDIQDYYLEELDDSDNPTRYRFGEEWRDLTIEKHTIRVKDAPDEEWVVHRTHHGAILNSIIGRLRDAPPMALQWSGERGTTVFQSLFDLARATDWPSFRQALSTWDGPHMSFIYADASGNIGFQAAGRVPIRNPNHPGSVPVPGWTGEYEWGPAIPYELMPHSANPPEGFVVAANHKAIDDDYPFPMGYEWADPYRALRITEVLAESDQTDLDDHGSLQNDTMHWPARELRPHLLELLEAEDEHERAALDALTNWNLRLDPGEIGAAVYQAWYWHFFRAVAGDELGDKLLEEYGEYYWVHGPAMRALIDQVDHPLFDDSTTSEIEGRDDIAQRAFRETVAWLREHYGDEPTDWRWGRMHPLTLTHRPLGMADIPILSGLANGGPVPAPGGDRFTVNAAWFSTEPESPFDAEAGAAQRILIDVGDWDSSLAINSTGQSEHLFHRHREDQLELWQQGKYHPLPFSRKAVEAASKNTLNLVPEGP